MYGSALLLGDKCPLRHLVDSGMYFLNIKRKQATVQSESVAGKRMDWPNVIPFFNGHSQQCGDTATMVEGNLGQVGLPGIAV